MIDEGVVVEVKNGLARVRVTPQTACCECSARTVCLGDKGTEGVMTTLNPLHAEPGDKVSVEIPDSALNWEAIRIFGFLLVSILAGFGIGSLAAPVFHTSTSVSGPAGVGLGLACGALGFFMFSRRGRRRPLTPVIREIISKGAGHEPT